ncbi:MAG: transglycosylase SLT domain-containing protein [Mucinivorans sp.]
MNFTTKKVLTVVLISLFAEFTFIGCSHRSDDAMLQLEKDAQDGGVLVSEFDPIMRRAASVADMDWLLLSAIAHTESRFQSDARSSVGAIGIMQVMPSVARSFGVSPEEAKNAEVNVALAIRVLKSSEQGLRLNAASERDRISIILACYNNGIGNVLEARRRAAQAGVDHNNWQQLKKFAPISGTQTPAFVNQVLQKWEEYKKMYS